MSLYIDAGSQEVNPKFPLDTCPLLYGSDPVLLCRPAIPIGHVLSPPRRSTVDSWHCEAKEFPQ